MCLKYGFRINEGHTYPLNSTGPGSSVGRVSASGTGGHWFDPRLRHTKVNKMVLAAPCLALRLTG